MQPGLDILNTGRGHTELHFDKDDVIEVERAKRIIEDMLDRGYLLFVEGDDGKASRVLAFCSSTGRYIIGDRGMHSNAEPLPEDWKPNTMQPLPPAEESAAGEKPSEPAKRRRGRPPKADAGKQLGAVPMNKTRATAVGRSAGG